MDLPGMVGRLDGGEEFSNHPLRIDDDAAPPGDVDPHELREGAVLLGDFELIVGEDLKVEMIFFGELLVRCDRVDADSEDRRVEMLNGNDVVSKGAGLFCAAGGIILRIKIKNHPLSPQG